MLRPVSELVVRAAAVGVVVLEVLLVGAAGVATVSFNAGGEVLAVGVGELDLLPKHMMRSTWDVKTSSRAWEALG